MGIYKPTLEELKEETIRKIIEKAKPKKIISNALVFTHKNHNVYSINLPNGIYIKELIELLNKYTKSAAEINNIPENEILIKLYYDDHNNNFCKIKLFHVRTENEEEFNNRINRLISRKIKSIENSEKRKERQKIKRKKELEQWLSDIVVELGDEIYSIFNKIESEKIKKS